MAVGGRERCADLNQTNRELRQSELITSRRRTDVGLDPVAPPPIGTDNALPTAPARPIRLAGSIANSSQTRESARMHEARRVRPESRGVGGKEGGGANRAGNRKRDRRAAE